MQIIFRARDIAEAHIVAGFLQSNGIVCHVGGHYLQGAIGELGIADFAVIRVEDNDIPAARDLVKQYEERTYSETSSPTKGVKQSTTSPLMAIALFLISVVLLIFLMS